MQKNQFTIATILLCTALMLSACVSPRKPTTLRGLLEAARDAVAVGQYDRAVDKLKQAHKITPLDARILYDIAQIRYEQGQYAQAAHFARKAIYHATSPTLSKKAKILLAKAKKH